MMRDVGLCRALGACNNAPRHFPYPCPFHHPYNAVYAIVSCQSYAMSCYHSALCLIEIQHSWTVDHGLKTSYFRLHQRSHPQPPFGDLFVSLVLWPRGLLRRRSCVGFVDVLLAHTLLQYSMCCFVGQIVVRMGEKSKARTISVPQTVQTGWLLTRFCVSMRASRSLCWIIWMSSLSIVLAGAANAVFKLSNVTQENGIKYWTMLLLRTR